jgi:hypothetical protein
VNGMKGSVTMEASMQKGEKSLQYRKCFMKGKNGIQIESTLI